MVLQRWEINEVSSMIRTVSREKAHRKGLAGFFFFFFEVKKWNWECGRPRKLEITNQNIKEESCRERIPEISRQSPHIQHAN